MNDFLGHTQNLNGNKMHMELFDSKLVCFRVLWNINLTCVGVVKLC